MPLLAFYFRTAGILQADARKAVIRLVAGGGQTGALRRVAALRRRRHPLPMGDGISADLRPFIAETDARARLLEEARAMAVVDPDVPGGSEPVVRGTRVPVRDVVAAVFTGLPVAEILASYPGLQAEQVELAALYASVERPRGSRVAHQIIPLGVPGRWRFEITGSCRPLAGCITWSCRRPWPIGQPGTSREHHKRNINL